MKIIHCSDIHLDSAMKNLKDGKAKERKDELRLSFESMIKFASSNDVKAIIIAGDMFDKTVLKKTENYIVDLFSTYSDIDFLYLSGNHDENSIMQSICERLNNVKLLSENAVCYDDVCIYGLKPIAESSYDSLSLEREKTNIVVMHGQVDDYSFSNESINLRKLKNKNVDYLAMGHIHSFTEYKLDERAMAVYSGCLEGRGFDELGQKGFILLDCKDGKVDYKFIPSSRRVLHEVEVDITGCETVKEIDSEILIAVNHIVLEDLVKVVLVGGLSLEAEKDIEHIEKVLNDIFYFAKVKDKTRLKLDLESIKNDISLKGEFVRQVLSSSLDDESKERIIRYGIKALNGEEIE